MSTKTLRKRIALVAVSALGFGLLSASPTFAAISAPTNLTCTSNTSGEINLSWTAPATLSAPDTSVVSYTYSTNNDTTYKALPTGGGAATTTRTITEVSTAATALANGTIYLVSIKAVSNNPTTSAASNIVACATGIPDPSEMFISTTASVAGGADQASGLSVGAKSQGWVTQTSATATAKYAGLVLSGGNAATGVVLANAKIAFNATSTVTSGDSLGVVVSGGTISGFACLNAGTASLNGSSTTAACVQASTTRSTAYGVFNVSAAAGSTATLSIYKGTNIAGTTTATNGSLIGTWTFTVASASASGVFSAANSTVTIQPEIAKGATTSSANAFDTTDRISNGGVGVIYVALKDAYTAAITSGTLTVSATNSATVNVVDTSGASDAYAATSSFDTISLLGSDGIGYIVVNQPVANTAGSSTVTLVLDGTTIATKTLNWNGDIASLTVLGSSKTTFANGVTVNCSAAPSLAGSAANVVYVAKDAAGNAVTLSASPTVTGATGSLVGATVGSGNSATAAHGCIRQTAALGYGATTMAVPSTALQGAGTYKLRVTNAAGVNIDSAEQKATVSNGSTDKFTASWDKATYAPGELATLTIKIQDAYGNLMAAGTPLTGLALSVATGFTAVGTACANTSLVDSAGVVTCQYAAGNTEGAYSFSIDLDTGTTQAATVGALNVKNTTAAVSNAEVLAAIVKLIASINKQIKALQKSLRR